MSQLLLSTLGVVCPTCDEYNAPKAAKCVSCGSAVYVDKAPGAATARQPGGSGPKQPPAAPPIAAGGSGQKPAAPGRHSGMEVGKLPQSILDKAKMPSQPPGMRPSGKAAPEPGSPGAPIPASELVKKAPAAKFGLLVLAGGSKGQRFRLAATTCQVGRSKGAIMFPDDPFLGPVHATFLVRDGTLILKDEGSASGVFVAIAGQESLAPNALFAAGHRLFRFTGPLRAPPAQPGAPIVYGAPVPSGNVVYGVEEILVGGRPGRGVVTGSPLLTIGQSLCDLSYPKDDGLATRHCELAPTPQGALLRDLSGGLGTYVRVSGERVLNFGDRVRMGEQVLQVEA